jgi:hypothetical protein
MLTYTGTARVFAMAVSLLGASACDFANYPPQDQQLASVFSRNESCFTRMRDRLIGGTHAQRLDYNFPIVPTLRSNNTAVNAADRDMWLRCMAATGVSVVEATGSSDANGRTIWFTIYSGRGQQKGLAFLSREDRIVGLTKTSLDQLSNLDLARLFESGNPAYRRLRPHWYIFYNAHR